jgi:hypothetical protein
MDRNRILKKDKQIGFSEISWCFIADYYDRPVSGLLYFKDTIRYFCCFQEDMPEQEIYVILNLSQEETAQLIREKEEFEAMVGTHWSFDRNGNRPAERSATPESAKQYYKRQTTSFALGPFDREVSAWFVLDASS